MKIWIVGKYVYHSTNSKVSAWEFAGAFSKEKNAVKACKSRNYFYAPAVLNQPIPDKREKWIGLRYPIAEQELQKH